MTALTNLGVKAMNTKGNASWYHISFTKPYPNTKPLSCLIKLHSTTKWTQRHSWPEVWSFTLWENLWEFSDCWTLFVLNNFDTLWSKVEPSIYGILLKVWTWTVLANNYSCSNFSGRKKSNCSWNKVYNSATMWTVSSVFIIVQQSIISNKKQQIRWQKQVWMCDIDCTTSNTAIKTLTWKCKMIVQINPRVSLGFPSVMSSFRIFTSLTCVQITKKKVCSALKRY